MSPSPALVALYVLYALVGTASVFGHALVVIAILRDRALRRQFVLVCALSCADGLGGLRYAVSNCTISALTSGRSAAIEFYFGCPLDVVWIAFADWSWFFMFQLPPILCVLIALDRLCCVCVPDVYRRQRPRAQELKLTLAGFSIALLSASAMFFATTNSNCYAKVA